MRKFNSKLITTVILSIGLTLSCFNSSVFAETATGPNEVAYAGNMGYLYWSSIQINANGATARAHVEGYNVPTGYVGIDSRLFNANGTLVTSTGMDYLQGFSGIVIYGSQTHKGKGTYYSQGRMAFYNNVNGGYIFRTSIASPRLTLNSAAMIPNEPYKVNELGLTYGSDFYAESIEDSPDLIRVIGKNGIEGYVYSVDINPNLSTLDEVLEYISAGQSNYSVPVYAEDGIAVIDTFELNSED